jgi:two-component system, OmpR family, response regulator RpaA
MIANPKSRIFNSTGHGPDKVYTTGQVAKICQVAPRTAGKWIDSGALPGYRIPGSQDRRVTRAALLDFLAKHNMPTARVQGDGMVRVLYVGTSPLPGDVLPERGGFLLRSATGPFECGILAAEFAPHAVVVDFASLGRIDCGVIANGIRSRTGGESIALVLLGSPADGFDLGYDCALGTVAGLPSVIHEILDARRSGVKA